MPTKTKPRDRADKAESAKSEKHEKIEKVEKSGGKTDKANTKPAPAGKGSSSSRPAVKPATREVAKRDQVNGSKNSSAKPPSVLRSPFNADDLSKWRLLLITKRAALTNDIAQLEKDAMEAEDGHTTPQHSAERGSDADLQDVSLGLAGDEKEILWQIDRAIRKIDSSEPIPYGLCEFTKSPIPRTRLELMPWTALSIEGAVHMEDNHLTLEDVLVEG